ncbi:hypothetical protein [Stomatohabitans albus]|uniref:hypothetical protein n=1 Tax=Stomatohabitans albus TaxID=3110766 RepID=UPI00300D6664
MASKYKTKNTFTLWWNNASRGTRIGTVIGAVIVGALVLVGLGFLGKFLFDIQADDTSRARTTIELPAQGVQESDEPSSVATPELPPLDLPTPTPTPMIATDEAVEGSSELGSQGSSSAAGNGNGRDSQGGTGNTPTFDTILAAGRRSCVHTEQDVSPTGEPILRAYQPWSDGDFNAILPCIETMVTESRDAGVNIEILVQTDTQPAGYLLIRTADVQRLNQLDQNARATQLREAFQVAPGLQLK